MQSLREVMVNYIIYPQFIRETNSRNRIRDLLILVEGTCHCTKVRPLYHLIIYNMHNKIMSNEILFNNYDHSMRHIIKEAFQSKVL